MATRRDQLDAYVFARRRMVSNLVAPSPTGSDQAAPRPVRTFFTSAILSAVAVAGVAVLGVFKPAAPGGWTSGLAVDSTSGAAYVYSRQDSQLHPILNITSARLLLGDNFNKFDVPDNVINGQGQTIGAPFGIPGAPPDVPGAASVDLTQWNLCLTAKNPLNQSDPNGTTTLEVGYSTAAQTALTPFSGFVVHDPQGVNYLITGDYAYPIADNATLDALNGFSVAQGTTTGPWVSAAWLDAFRQGSPLAFPSVADLGAALPGGLTGQPGQHVGDFGADPDGKSGYVETDSGLVQVSYFVYKLYSGNSALKGKVRELQLSRSDIVAASPRNELKDARSLRGASATWPTESVEIEDIDGTRSGYEVLCVTYGGQFDGDLPALALYHGSALPHPLRAGGGVLQSGGSAFADVIDVRPGHAALSRSVTSGSSTTTGPLYLTPDTGTRYGLTPPATALTQLRYKTVAPEPVPNNWMQLIQAGSTLDPALAGTTPSLSGQ